VAACCQGKTGICLGYPQIPNPYRDAFYRVGLVLNEPKNSAVAYEEQHVGDVMEVGKIFAGRTFDSVICGELIEHLKEPYAFLDSLRAILPKNGRLIVSTPNPLGFPVLFCEITGNQRFFFTREHVYYFLPRWVGRLLEATGYRLIDTQAVGLWLPGAWLPIWPKILSYQLVYVAEREDSDV